MSKSPTRLDKALPHLYDMAWLWFVLQQEHPKDYILLSTFKYFRHISETSHLDTIQALLGIPDEELNIIISRMKSKGWITVSRGYVSVERPGHAEYFSIKAKIVQVVAEMRNNEPIRSWTRLKD